MEISDNVKNKIVEYYKKLHKVGTAAEVKAILTAECYERAIDNVLSEVVSRKRRGKLDEANAYTPPDAELIDAIQAKIDQMNTGTE